MSKPVVIKILGDASSLSKALGTAEGGLKRLGGFAANVGKAALVAGAGVAGASVKMAVDFEQSMANVFTLLPGMSDAAFADMGDQVLDLSAKMGVLPSEVVPALYDAISAGVPVDNVFAFMESATELAIGGSIEMSAAVDLLTTSQNAWAASGITAAEAADLSTLAVRNGKITMEEFAGTLSMVAPISAAFGVSMEDTAIGMAALTAQGIPARVAGTQLKGMFAELGKEGTKASKVFSGLAGESFPEFIAAGGNLEGAMRILADSGDPIIDMFGSIEAGAGALALTANDMEGLAGTTASFAEGAAGASAAAFAKMEETSARSMEKLRANVAVMGVQIGEKLLPVLAAVTGFIVDNIPKWKEAFADVVGFVRTKFVPPVVEAFEVVRDRVEQAFDFIKDNVLPPVVEAFETVKGVIVGTVLPALETAFDAVKGAAVVAFDYVKDNVLPPLTAAFETVKGVVVDTVWPALVTAFDAVKGAAVTAFDYVKDNVLPPLTAAFETVKAVVVDTIIPALDTAFGVVKDAAVTAFDYIGDTVLPALETAFDVVKGTIVDTILPAFETALGAVKTAAVAVYDWVIDNWDEIKDTMAGAFDFIVTSADLLVDALEFVVDALVDIVKWIAGNEPILIGLAVTVGVGLTVAFYAWASSMVAAAVAGAALLAPFVAAAAVITLLTAAVVWAYQNVDFFRGYIDLLWSTSKTVFGWLKEKVPAAITAVINAFMKWKGDVGKVILFIKGMFFKLKDGVVDVFFEIVEFAKKMPMNLFDAIKGGASLMVSAGKSLIGGLLGGITEKFGEIISFVTEKIGWLAEKASDAKGLFDAVTNPIGFVGGLFGGGDKFDSSGAQSWSQGQANSGEKSDQELAWDAANGKQHGGPLSSGLTLVGERGPELFDIPNGMGGGSVIANQDMDGVGGGGVVVNVSTNADPWAIGAAVAWELRRAG